MKTDAAGTKRNLIIAESHAIALPIVVALGLQTSGLSEKFRCYAGDGALLVESRGRAAAGALVGYLLGHVGYGPETALLHIGRSEPSEDFDEELAGRLIVVNRVRDSSTGCTYYPDILLAHRLPEAGVCTAGGRVSEETGSCRPDLPLIDQELAGIVSAALLFLAPHQVFCLQAVVGRREGGQRGLRSARSGDEADEQAIVAHEVVVVQELFEAFASLLRPHGATLEPRLQRMVEEVGREMRLTVAQSSLLGRLAEGAARRGLDVETILATGRSATRPQSKHERNRQFNELRRSFEE